MKKIINDEHKYEKLCLVTLLLVSLKMSNTSSNFLKYFEVGGNPRDSIVCLKPRLELK